MERQNQPAFGYSNCVPEDSKGIKLWVRIPFSHFGSVQWDVSKNPLEK